MDELLPPQVLKLQSKTTEVAAERIVPRTEGGDRDSLWPEHSMQAQALGWAHGALSPPRECRSRKY